MGLIKITSHLVIGVIYGIEGRSFDQATVHTRGTAGVKTAAAFDLTAQLLLRGKGYISIPSLIGVGHGNRVNEQLNIRMLGVLYHLDGIALFGDTATLAQTGSTVTAAIASDGVSLTLTDSSAYSGNELSVDSSNAASDLGFIRADTDHDGVLEGDRLLSALGSKLLKNINGGTGVTMDQATGPSVLTPTTLLSDLFDGAGLTDDPANSDITFHARDQKFVSYIIEMDGLTTVQDLMDAFDTTTGGRVTLSIEGRALRATDNTGGSFDLAIEDRNFSQAMTELGLAVNAPVDTVLGNDTYPLPQPTSGFGPGSIRITTRDGTVNDVSLTDARSVYDVIQAINDAGIGVTLELW